MIRYLTNPKGKRTFLWYHDAKILAIYLCALGFVTQPSIAEKDCPDFECGDRIGDYADPCQCRRYYTCSNGAATKRICPNGLYWDDEKLFCTYKSEAKCGPISR